MRVRLPAWIVVSLSVAAVAAAPAGAGDGIDLALSHGASPDEVVLTWAGKIPTYEVYRSADPVAVVGATTRIGQTAGTQWTDGGPTGEIAYYVVVSRPPVLDDVLAAADTVAGDMETFRRLPTTILHGGQPVNAAQFLFLASRSLLAMSSEDPFPPTSPPGSLVPPGDPYPAIPLDDTYYSTAFTREEYLAFLRQWDDEYAQNGTYPESLVVDGTGAEVRFAETVYYAAGILRFEKLLGHLPAVWDRHIIATRGLVPWDTPSTHEEYTSALMTDGGTPFFPNHPRRYHASSAHEYDMLKRAREIYGNTRNAYKAGEKIYDWTMDTWQVTVGYTGGRTTFWGDNSGWEWANFFYHTSGPPRKVNADLFRAAGLPASVSGAAYFTSRGWVNIDVHMPYGTDPLDNPFYYDDIPPPNHNMPYPAASHDIIQGVNRVAATTPAAAAAGERRLVYLNPSDVLERGAAHVVDHAGQLDTLAVTVKTTQGYVYFAGSGWPERERGDALGPLIAEAHARGKKVYAGFSTLADRETCDEEPGWRQDLNETSDSVYPNLNISPCVQAYQDRLVSLLENLVAGYDVDGVVLDALYFANIYGNTDTVGHPDCPTGTDWMPQVINAYAADLAAAVRAVDPGVEVVLTAFPLGVENRYFGLGHEDLGHQSLADLAPVVDEVLLVFLGTYWVPVEEPYFLQVITDYRNLTGRDPWASFQLTDEWPYSPRFYRGLLNLVRPRGIGGFSLHTNLSSTGELSPGLTGSEWETLRALELRH